ncbi:MAG: hemolysin family protein [Anaerolineae bacterium]
MNEISILGVTLKLLAMATLILANGFFAAAEIALVSVRRTRVNQLVAEGSAIAKVIQQAISDPDRFIAAIQLGVTIASVGLGWIGEATIVQLLEPALHALPGGLLVPVSHTVAAIVAFALITFLAVVLGELAPKSIALQYPEKTAFIVARPTVITENIFRPFIWLLNGSSNSILHLIGLRAPTGHQRVHSVEELRQLVRESQKGGVLEAGHEEVVQKAFRFAARQVQEAMIPRPDIVGVEREATIADLLATFTQSSHARFPVYEGNLDNIVGIVAIKDVLMALAAEPTNTGAGIEALIRPTLFVPESRPIGNLLTEMRKRQTQMVVVLDEYGGTAGLVTLEELVEEIVGRLSDELVMEPAHVKAIDERTFQVDAQLRVDEVNEALGLSLPEGDDYETVAGFILYLLRRIPKEGEQLRHGDLRITVTGMKGPKIEQVQITRI